MIGYAERRDRLTPDEVSAVVELARAAGDTDGAYPLSEHTVLHLRHGGDAPAVHLIARTPDGELAGYAHVDTTDAVDGPAAELVVHPLRRRHGLGRALVKAAIAAAAEADPDGRLRLWAHGDHPSASALALSLGFRRARVLWQMRRSLFAEVPQPDLPAGVVLRPFRPGEDDEPWLALNARAFADHPEQGRWTLRDLHVRMAEPWFDPAGFLLAERDGVLAGFHWTKVHGELRRDAQDAHHHDPIGEVYVLGVDPAAHGSGLGRALTAAGLRHLRAQGLDQVMLYVDESNTAATALYQRLGFARWSTDVLFQRT
ncbi:MULTISPECIES: mycothiol synthase [Catellatospora]|uniref:Mycothiol acetyltransferase n=1 Tax=Catellatospora chokoriensis TaxID=310353 RepID=A0A8J3JR75_9ACTN|nr:mycothiol synthase [Catellatospora chokoriensis]GIF89597.1 mycothiol acetyltransferase [Catellatospora chokoriensis]